MSSEDIIESVLMNLSDSRLIPYSDISLKKYEAKMLLLDPV